MSQSRDPDSFITVAESARFRKGSLHAYLVMAVFVIIAALLFQNQSTQLGQQADTAQRLAVRVAALQKQHDADLADTALKTCINHVTDSASLARLYHRLAEDEFKLGRVPQFKVGSQIFLGRAKIYTETAQGLLDRTPKNCKPILHDLPSANR